MKATQEEVNKILLSAYGNGVNFIDTGRSYKASENKIGNALSEYGLRKHFFLATKSLSRRQKELTDDINESLMSLRTDYIDLYQMHDVRFQDD